MDANSQIASIEEVRNGVAEGIAEVSVPTSALVVEIAESGEVTNVGTQLTEQQVAELIQRVPRRIL